MAKKKGGEDWERLLLDLYLRAERARMRESYEELRRLLTEEELNEILRASEEFRERFKLR